MAMSTPPTYDPAELAAEGLTEEEAEGIRVALEQIDRGETVSSEDLRAELTALVGQGDGPRKTG